ncbi:MAG: FG-GAP-like repeat-containing protein [Planctomycetota bacterium]
MIARVFFFCLLLSVNPAFAQPSAQTSANPPELIGLLQKAQGLLGTGKMAEAEGIMLDASRKFPDRPAAWYMLGYSRHSQKKYDDAMAAYERANKLAQGQAANTQYNMACIYAIRMDKDKAFELLDAAVKAGFTNINLIHSDPELANLKGDKRLEKFKVKWLSDDELFVESSRVIHKWSGEAAGDQFGWIARRVGDIDKDNVIDFVATAPTHNSGAGKVYVYSSRTGKLLHTVTGEPGFQLGNSACGLGDANGDGVPDFIAGAPNANGAGAVFVYSGADAKIIHRIDGSAQGGQFGYEVCEMGDINSDGVSDFLVGEMAGNGKVAKAGRVLVHSGKTAEVLFDLKGEEANDGFGNAAAAARLKDGSFLLAIGAQNAGPNDRGRVYVYEVQAAKPKLKFTIEGDKNSVNLGQMFISFPGDLDGDGIPDVYASDFSDNSQVTGGGKVVVHSGADGKELLAIHGSVPGEGLGTSPSDAGDVDGDGIGDLVIGAWQNREGAQSGGKVYLYSASGGGRLLQSWTAKQAGDTLGFDACGIGDVDGDGYVDILLTSAWSNKVGQKTGRVFIMAGDDFSKRESKARNHKRLIAGKVSTVLDDIEAGTGGLNIDSEGRLYTADFGWRLDGSGKGGNRLYRVTPEGKSELFHDKLRGGSGNTFDANGNLYQSSIGGNFISKVTPDGRAEVFCKTGLQAPVGLAFNSKGTLFACNCGNNTIQQIAIDGTSKPFCTSPLLKTPNGIAVGPDDMMYVCNFGNGLVVQIDLEGNATKLATLPGGNNGHLIYHRGYLYILARMDCRVYEIDLAGRVTVFAGNGKRGKQNGAPLESSFSLPNSLIISPDEKYLYVNETSPISGDHRILGPTRIRRIELTVGQPDVGLLHSEKNR